MSGPEKESIRMGGEKQSRWLAFDPKKFSFKALREIARFQAFSDSEIGVVNPIKNAKGETTYQPFWLSSLLASIKTGGREKRRHLLNCAAELMEISSTVIIIREARSPKPRESKERTTGFGAFSGLIEELEIEL